jgi:hypothetical protein
VGNNTARLNNFHVDVPVPSFLNTSATYTINAAIPYVAGVGYDRLFSSSSLILAVTDDS